MLFGGIIASVVLFEGFFLLRDSQAPKLITALAAMVWGAGGMAILYLVANQLAEFAPVAWQKKLIPLVFVGPAIAFVIYFLALPTIRTFIASLFNRDGTVFVGLENYITVFTEPFMLVTFRNNLLWLVFGAGFTVLLGLAIAAFADRSRHEKIAKTIIFMPMAISLVGAGVIWKFIYAVKDPSESQIGLLNAIVVAFGFPPSRPRGGARLPRTAAFSLARSLSYPQGIDVCKV